MIFITKKAFEDELEKRIGEIHFKTRMDEDLWKLKDEVRELQHKVEMLEQARNTTIDVPSTIFPATRFASPLVSSPNVYESAPYWTNPNWKAPDITCTVPQTDIVKDAVPT